MEPSELLVVHGVHGDAGLFAWNDNILGVLLDGKKGSCLNVVVAMVFHQIFDGLTDCRAFLNLVEDDNGTPLRQCDIIDELELGEKVAAVRDVFYSLPNFLWSIGKVNNNVAVILVSGKFFGNS